MRLPLSTSLRERCFQAVAWGCAGTVTVLFGWILSDLVLRGATEISISFLFENPKNAGREGGIASVLASTALIVLTALTAAFPPALAASAFLAQLTAHRGLAGQFVRSSLEILAGVPSIVFGLFGNAFFSQVLGLGFSILSGGLTLACMILPFLIRSTEEGMRVAYRTYRQTTSALALTRSGTFFHVILPAAAPALLAGTMLGLGRAMAETAALLFTSGYVYRMPESLLDSGRALSVHVLDLAMNVAGGQPRAYASALVLVAFLFVINFATRQLFCSIIKEEPRL